MHSLSLLNVSTLNEEIVTKLKILTQAARDPAGKIAEKAMRRSVFLTTWHRILNADSTKTPSSSVTF